ncbi:hypothetical protein GALMADRAFT_207405 [Galerina marginata CBS 339.88]|uniref:Uncharacterized protein n=1 Tax=Galerina marginata (strain CBS 339.88) TaxID=685588 RepID=A0A067TIA3_GALM3|nr:hypothetical protein GALMADRAFT_207405 [Galerina marginata CBS 339.88]
MQGETALRLTKEVGQRVGSPKGWKGGEKHAREKRTRVEKKRDFQFLYDPEPVLGHCLPSIVLKWEVRPSIWKLSASTLSTILPQPPYYSANESVEYDNLNKKTSLRLLGAKLNDRRASSSVDITTAEAVMLCTPIDEFCCRPIALNHIPYIAKITHCKRQRKHRAWFDGQTKTYSGTHYGHYTDLNKLTNIVELPQSLSAGASTTTSRSLSLWGSRGIGDRRKSQRCDKEIDYGRRSTRAGSRPLQEYAFRASASGSHAILILLTTHPRDLLEAFWQLSFDVLEWDSGKPVFTGRPPRRLFGGDQWRGNCPCPCGNVFQGLGVSGLMMEDAQTQDGVYEFDTSRVMGQ